jgi:hypothetical protein
MKKLALPFILLLLLAACGKESTSHTYKYPGFYEVWGTESFYSADSAIGTTQVHDTVYIGKVDNQTLSFNGIAHKYNPDGSGQGNSLFEKIEPSIISYITFRDGYPDSMYYQVTHGDGIGGGDYINLHGFRISN